jgi:hypothetical protein
MLEWKQFSRNLCHKTMLTYASLLEGSKTNHNWRERDMFTKLEFL